MLRGQFQQIVAKHFIVRSHHLLSNDFCASSAKYSVHNTNTAFTHFTLPTNTHSANVFRMLFDGCEAEKSKKAPLSIQPLMELANILIALTVNSPYCMLKDQRLIVFSMHFRRFIKFDVPLSALLLRYPTLSYCILCIFHVLQEKKYSLCCIRIAIKNAIPLRKAPALWISSTQCKVKFTIVKYL